LNNIGNKYKGYESLQKSILSESIKLKNKISIFDSIFNKPIYDIFLSYAFDDKELIFGLYYDFTYNFNFKVYIDWIVDSSLNRENVTKENAKILRNRMKQSKSLIYVVSNNAQDSNWTQWETGYFDVQKEKAAILPIPGDYDITIDELEYLKLFQLMRDWNIIWISRNDLSPSYKTLKEWIN